MSALKVRHVIKQYLYYYNDNRLEKMCNEILQKSDQYLEKNYKAELFNISRKFGNPLMERIHQEVAQGLWIDVFSAGYVATLDSETQSLLK